MDWIVTTGETVEAALENALDELSVTADDVEYEVLQEPKKTLFGFRNTEAQIKPVCVRSQPQLNVSVVVPPDQKKRKKTKAHRPKPKSASETKTTTPFTKTTVARKQPSQNKCESSNNATTMTRQSQTPRLASAH